MRSPEKSDASAGSPPALVRTKFRSAIAAARLPSPMLASARSRMSSSLRMIGMGVTLVEYTIGRTFEAMPCVARLTVPTTALLVARRSRAPSVRRRASVRNSGTATMARGAGSNSGLVASPDAMLYTWYTPVAKPAVVPAEVLMNDSLRAVSASAQRPRYTSRRALRPRLTRRNVAGVLKPAKPVVSANGNAVPAAPRSFRASSNSAAVFVYASSRVMNVPCTVGSLGTSNTRPNVSRTRSWFMYSSAMNVFTNPFTPLFCAAV